jgi:hypothetical protein
MRLTGVLAAVAAVTALACARPAPRATAGPWQATGPAAFADTATVRRLCVVPDDVLAGRRPCVLRDQGVLPRIF